MEYLKVIAFTYRNTQLKDLGTLFIGEHLLEERLRLVKNKFNLSEIFYLSTCNRTEFVFITAEAVDGQYVAHFIRALNFDLSEEKLEELSSQASIYTEKAAVHHLLRMSCSLESLIIGEKEILTQLRKAYEGCRKAGFTGDGLRMVMDHVVKSAKEVYTVTEIAKKPISVVSLAYRKLKELRIPSHARVLIIGAGETSRNLSKYLQKHTCSTFVVFNRTLAKAERLAKELNGVGCRLADLKNYHKGFDILITCTSAPSPIITKDIYQVLLNGESGVKIVIDLAVPNDICQEVIADNPIHFIEIGSLQDVAEKNLQARYEELARAEQIIHRRLEEFTLTLQQRKLELAMSEVPKKIKEIKALAINSIFAEDIQTLDDHSFKVLERVTNYMEKKYISIPMVMAKEILAKNS